ncbi:MAG: S-layer homology domain-containing protein, partial [Oscillospiraceae bacterium]|nr:S-layer homology domain-containing protein [Oscillospiraceae bacterium]
MKTAKYRLACLVLVLVLSLSALPAAALWEAPDEPATRRMVVSGLWELEGQPYVNYIMPFRDVDQEEDWAEAVRWAAAEKIVLGIGGSRFAPEGKVTREALAAMLYRYAIHEGMDVSAGESTNILSYEDAFTWSDWAAEPLQWAVGAGILTDTEGFLRPRQAATQAEARAALRQLSVLASLGDALNLWTDGARAKTELMSYVAAVTDAGSRDFIPVEDRIAVFDLDGTLFCETDPNYFDYTLLKYRVLEDPEYKDRASDFEREVANKIKEQNETGASFAGLEVDHGRAVASAFAGMTLNEFNEYIQEFKKQPMPGYEGMLRGEGWYLPMLEVVSYLKENGFTVYIVSGTDRLIVRGIAYNSPLGIPNRQIIGSDETIVSNNQNGADGLDYVFADGDQLVLAGEFVVKNLKMNKVSVIMQEIGQQPVLSFGNSTGDSSMAEFVTSGNKYRSLAFMLCCDDTVRENGNEAKAQKMLDLCGEFDWVPISMKNDWVTIY